MHKSVCAFYYQTTRSGYFSADKDNKMAKVNFKYRIEVTQSYVPTLYKSKTIEIDLPKNEHGVILHLTLADMLEAYIKK